MTNVEKLPMSYPPTPPKGAEAAVPTLAEHYDRLFNECLALANTHRSVMLTYSSFLSFHADQHRRCLLRASAYARLADRARKDARYE